MTTIFTPGTIIKARRRLWRVDAQDENILSATPIDGVETSSQKFYIPMEDIKSGRIDPPNPALIGHISSQDLLLRAYRLSLMHGSAPFLSLQRSCVIPTNYQLVPLVMALEMSQIRLLIADDVGLGKTIEAGLIVSELLARQRASRLLVICPANLREQWQEALHYFFHLGARIISSRHRREMERELPSGANPWEYYPFLITSIDYVKSPAIKNQLIELDWDIVLIDEAHIAAKPHQFSSDQKVLMDRWQLAEAISKKARHLLLLTATPHNGYTDSFASLIRMLNQETVAGPAHEPIILKTKAVKHVCQRRRKDVEDWFERDGQKSPFAQRDPDIEVFIDPSSQLREVIHAVQHYGKQTLEEAEEANFSHHAFLMARWTVMHLQKRALSSPEALRISLKHRLDAIENKLDRFSEAEMEEALLSLEEAKANVFDADAGDRLSDEEAGRRSERTVFGHKEILLRQKEAIIRLAELTKKVTPTRDSKLQKLIQKVLPARLACYPKVIIFTRYKDTLAYLEKSLSKTKNFANVELVTMYGDLSEAERKKRFKRLERAGKAVMIATDCISEGINLQHACAQIIHYELPWNPNRLEQRNGRVDRFGQRESTVYINTLVMNETLDFLILKVLIKKAHQIRSDYGFAPPYFGDDINILDLIYKSEFKHNMAKHHVQLRLFDDPKTFLSSGENVRMIDPLSDESVKRIKEESFYGQISISIPDIEKRLRDMETAVGSTDQIKYFVLSGLHKFRCSASENKDGTYRIRIANPSLYLASLGAEIPRATFDPKAAQDDPDLIVLDIGHPLVRRLIEIVKQEVFLPGPIYGRTAAMVTPEVTETTAVFHLLARYAVKTNPMSIIEEIVPIAFPVYEDTVLDDIATSKLIKAQPTPESRTDREISETLQDALNHLGMKKYIQNALDERKAFLSLERAKLRERLFEGADSLTAQWLQGIDKLENTSKDLLTATIYYPT